MPHLKLYFFGPPRVGFDETVVEINRRKALALLVYLAVDGQPHSRDALATLFYPDHSQSQARAYLRRDLALLNASPVGEWLDSDRETIELKPTPELWLDVARFRQNLVACQRHAPPPETPCLDCLPWLTEAVELYTADFLAGFTLRDCPDFDEWQFFQAESLRQANEKLLELRPGLRRHPFFRAVLRRTSAVATDISTRMNSWAQATPTGPVHPCRSGLADRIS